MIPYAILSGTIISEITSLIKLLLIVLFYILFWISIFYFINIYGSGSSDQAIKMVSIWLALCIIIPGAIHQISSINYSINYMTEYIDTNRDKSNDIFNLPHDSLRIELLKAFPELQSTIHGKDITQNNNIINKSVSALINILNKNIANEIEAKNEEKNKFITSLNQINPIMFFQNTINSLTKTDYYAYKKYRKTIQSKIDKQINFILLDTWNKININKEKYLQYVEIFK